MRFFSSLLVCLFMLGCVDPVEIEGSSPAVTRVTSNGTVFTVAAGFQSVNRGPSASKGVVYYFGGHSTSFPTPVDDNIVQPHLLSMNKQGWDVFRANPPIAMRRNSMRAELASNMNALAENAKKSGYAKVVFVGQSFGAWNILLAGENPSFDKFVAFAPACCGIAENARGSERTLWEERMLRIVEMGKMSKATGLIFLFKDDEFYTPNVTNTVARANYQNVEVLNQPAGFTGHGSGWLDAFDYVFGDCLARYVVSSSKTFSCQKRSLSPSDHRWMANEDHLKRGNATQVTTAEASNLLVGNTLAGRGGGDLVNIFFTDERKFLVEFRSGYNSGDVQRVSYHFKDNLFCANSEYFKQGGSSGCFRLYKWPTDRLFIAVNEQGGIVFKGRILNGNPRKL